MPNSFASELVVGVLSDTFITAVSKKWLKYEAFSTDFSTDVRDARSMTINVPVATSTEAVNTNPSDFTANSSSTLSACQVTLAHYQKPFYISQADINNGKRLESLARINAQQLADKIEAVFMAPVTETNYTVAVSGITAGALSVANVKTLWGALPGTEKNLLVATSEFPNLLPSDINGFDTVGGRGFGYSMIDYTDAGFSAAGSKIVGFGGSRGSIAVASALPEVLNDAALGVETITLPNGMSVLLVTWVDPSTRKFYASYELLFGASAADKTAGKLIKTA